MIQSMPLSRLLLALIMSVFLFGLTPASLTLADTEQPDFSNQNCLSCHAEVRQFITTSVHSDFSCLACHPNIGSEHLQDYRPNYEDPAETLISPQRVPETCGACHAEELDSYMESVHGRGLLLGSIETANCIDCHGSHNVLARSDPKATYSATRLPETCAKCHEEAQENFIRGTEHKSLAAGTGIAEHNTLKFFVWLTILTVVGLIVHMEVELFHLFKRSRRPKS